jgi:hypothetical protein
MICFFLIEIFVLDEIIDRDHSTTHVKANHSRSGSNPSSSESSCITQNTNETHYGFPSIISPLKHQSSSSSENSTPNRIKKLFYEVVV